MTALTLTSLLLATAAQAGQTKNTPTNDGDQKPQRVVLRLKPKAPEAQQTLPEELAWVRDHIAKFVTDGRNVVIIGSNEVNVHTRGHAVVYGGVAEDINIETDADSTPTTLIMGGNKINVTGDEKGKTVVYGSGRSINIRGGGVNIKSGGNKITVKGGNNTVYGSFGDINL